MKEKVADKKYRSTSFRVIRTRVFHLMDVWNLWTDLKKNLYHGGKSDLSVSVRIYAHAHFYEQLIYTLALFVNTTHVDELLLTSAHNTPRATAKTQ